ncbi:MAG: ATP synthase F1 subunit epsilon [Candidatus Absconditabacteria bacterium]|nr:ATP synthase F1 subunit epsilon [Candidatus Absconditabacteria bacterium]
MFLQINTPEGIIFEDKIEKITIPTQVGEISILKNHQPLISIVKPGIVKIKLHDDKKEEFIKGTKFLFEDEWLCLSVGSGFLYVNGTQIVILASTVTKEIQTDQEVLEKMKIEMEKQIEEIKAKGSLDEVEKAFLHLQKISADIKLYKIKQKN